MPILAFRYQMQLTGFGSPPSHQSGEPQMPTRTVKPAEHPLILTQRIWTVSVFGLYRFDLGHRRMRPILKQENEQFNVGSAAKQDNYRDCPGLPRPYCCPAGC